MAWKLYAANTPFQSKIIKKYCNSHELGAVGLRLNGSDEQFENLKEKSKV